MIRAVTKYEVRCDFCGEAAGPWLLSTAVVAARIAAPHPVYGPLICENCGGAVSDRVSGA